MMRHLTWSPSRSGRSAACAILIFLVPSAAAQVPLLDGTTPSASVILARYEAAIHAQVDSVVLAWQAAYAARDARDLSELYTRDAIIALSGGGALVGRTEIRHAFERLLTRMREPHITIDDIRRMEDVVVVRGTLIARVAGPAGSYERVSAIELHLRSNSWARLEIATQRGGDILALTPLSPRSGVHADLAPDTVRIRLVDVTGNGVPNAEVAFSITGNHGTIAPASTVTDGEGIAVAVFVASSLHETDVVTVRAALAPDEPAFFRFQMLAPAALAAARELIAATGARAHADSTLSRLIADRRRAMPDVPSATWDALSGDSAVNVAVELLAPLYADRFSEEAMRALIASYESPAGRESAAGQPSLNAIIPSAEQEWTTQLDQWIAAELTSSGYALPR